MNFEAFNFSERGLDGDRLCMDFANTARGQNPVRDEFLNTYTDMLSWAVFVNILSDAQADHLFALAQQRPAGADAVLSRGIALREAIFTLLEHASRDEPAPDGALTVLNAALSEALPHRQLAPEGPIVRWTWAEGSGDLGQMLWPVVWDAAALLTSEDRHRARVCESDTCDWVFLDTSRNHSRRWCSMESCGNRAKARRHYQRKAGTAE